MYYTSRHIPLLVPINGKVQNYYDTNKVLIKKIQFIYVYLITFNSTTFNIFEKP